MKERGKDPREYDKFRYGDAHRFERNLRKQGYDAFRIVEGDASAFDWSSLTSVGALLLDIDVYEPTMKVLEAVYPMLAPGGGIVLDDCLPDNPWDGSLRAYREFIEARGLPFIRVGHKGALVRGPEVIR
ncbi:TylF/MycF family methyltransferase [Nocardioides sp. B-3]|uniref:TylF/MycF family methyltransferase n=1 Tax=Nocardioides sp. B-3 TaxID=2895565 RepID=UPI0021525B26|nr:TylF/MycF family methyltransferase [Nocardioides sp. B-3]UUZ57714.1 TylF/MycF family methyltransferase [Nocardioides sp. B-3]